MTPALLLLEDGTRFDGKAFGAQGETTGHAVFYTGVVGYQEVLTSPSYRGTLPVLTYPIIGSSGVNPADSESAAVQAAGVVIKEYSRTWSNFRATGALEPFLQEHGVVGVRGVDTRALTVHLREHGEQRGLIASGDDLDPEGLLEKLRATPSPFESDLVADLPSAEAPPEPEEAKAQLVVLDLGATRSLLRHLTLGGAAVESLPAGTAAEDILAREADGVAVVGGPGDPRGLTDAAETVEALLGEVPVLGIGLGCQVLALALGCRIERLKAGHHGGNQPVKEPATGRCTITAQHHSFVVSPEGLPEGVEVTHVNVNDGTVEGIRNGQASTVGVQFHPLPDEMGRPNPVLAGFIEGRTET